MMRTPLFLFMGLILAVSVAAQVSAGLVINNSIVTVNKTSGQEALVNLVIQNTEGFTFYNVTFVSNPNVKISRIEQLNAGETKTVTANVTSIDNFQGDVRLIGFYQAQLGQPFANHSVAVSFTTGLSRCDFSVIRGDKVTWSNDVNDEIKLVNAVTGLEVTTIPQGGNYTANFDNPEVFSYHFERRGFKFTPDCTITTLADTGLINNPEYDAKLSLSVAVQYPATTISIITVQTNYSMKYGQQQEGVLTITNTGNETARNIILNGEWFSFSDNSFNLDPGISKGIIYTIHPVLNATDQTNKTHIKNISVSGNFPTQIREFPIFISYLLFSTNGSINASQDIIDFFTQLCAQNPTIQFCPHDPVVVFRDLDNASLKFNYTFSQEQVNQLFALLFDTSDKLDRSDNLKKETDAKTNAKIDSLATNFENLTGEVNEEKAKRQSNEHLSNIMIGLMGTVFASFIIVGIILIYRYRNNKEEYKTW